MDINQLTSLEMLLLAWTQQLSGLKVHGVISKPAEAFVEKPTFPNSRKNDENSQWVLL